MSLTPISLLVPLNLLTVRALDAPTTTTVAAAGATAARAAAALRVGTGSARAAPRALGCRVRGGGGATARVVGGCWFVVG